MRLIEIYKCFCDETRLRILNLLAQGPLCVCHVQEILEVGQVPVSKHLAFLREHRMVESRRHGQWMIYSLPVEPGEELHRQLQCLQDCARSIAVFKNDLKRLRKVQAECSWVAEAIKAEDRDGAAGRRSCCEA